MAKESNEIISTDIYLPNDAEVPVLLMILEGRGK